MRTTITLLWFLTAVTLLFLLAGVGLAFQNEPEGFRGLKWGAAPTEDMVYTFTEEGERIYKRLDDRMYIGNAQFVSILYSFHSEPERFCKVALYFKEEETFDLLKTICRARFGQEAMEEFFRLGWMGQKAMVGLRYDIVKEVGFLWLASMEIGMERTKAKEQEEVEKAEQDW